MERWSSVRSADKSALRSEFQVRLLFKNSEEVKRIRFSDRIRLGKRLHYECCGFSRLQCSPSAPYGPLFGAEPSSGL
jgi:hypothetical protein